MKQVLFWINSTHFLIFKIASPRISSVGNFQRTSVVQEEEKENKADESSLKKHRKNLSVGFAPAQNRMSENNKIPFSTLTVMPAPIQGESDLFVNNAGESLPALKAQ